MRRIKHPCGQGLFLIKNLQRSWGVRFCFVIPTRQLAGRDPPIILAKTKIQKNNFLSSTFFIKSGAKNRAVSSLRASCGSPSYFVLDLTLTGLGRPDKIDSGSPATVRVPYPDLGRD